MDELRRFSIERPPRVSVPRHHARQGLTRVDYTALSSTNILYTVRDSSGLDSDLVHFVCLIHGRITKISTPTSSPYISALDPILVQSCVCLLIEIRDILLA